MGRGLATSRAIFVLTSHTMALGCLAQVACSFVLLMEPPCLTTVTSVKAGGRLVGCIGWFWVCGELDVGVAIAAAAHDLGVRLTCWNVVLACSGLPVFLLLLLATWTHAWSTVGCSATGRVCSRLG